MNEVTQILDKLVRRREAANTQREQDPTTCMTVLVRVQVELLADLAVNFITKLWT